MEPRYSFGGDDHIFVEVDEEMSLDAFFKSLSMTSSGCSYFIHRYNFSSVFSFMCGQSLQAQLLVGGAGIKVFPGELNCIWCSIPASVATMNSEALEVWEYFNKAVVDPIKSARRKMGSSHSGCAINLAFG